MGSLIMLVDARQIIITGGARFEIDLASPGGQAAARMVPAHGPVLATETGWQSIVERQADQIIWTVAASSHIHARQIRALGFHGLMATGAHHQSHHFAIARGEISH